MVVVEPEPGTQEPSDSGEMAVSTGDSAAILVGTTTEVPVANPVPVGLYPEVPLPMSYIPPVGATTFPLPVALPRWP